MKTFGRLWAMTAVLAILAGVCVGAEPRAGQTTTETAGGVNLDLVWVPGGTFQMGNQMTPAETVRRYGGKEDFFKDEYPVHEVSVAGFWMGKCEVTNAQYRKFKPDHDSGQYEGNSLNGDEQPVVEVSWEDAVAYCEWLSGKSSGKRYQLPSEAQWEYACRAGTKTARYWGDDDESMGKYANVADRTAKSVFAEKWGNALKLFNSDFADTDDGFKVSAPVGRLRPNDFGLHDMIGNVREWCQDWYHESYDGAPSDGSAWESPAGQWRVLRGGSWSNDPNDTRSARRDIDFPGTGYSSGGFRVLAPRTN